MKKTEAIKINVLFKRILFNYALAISFVMVGVLSLATGYSLVSAHKGLCDLITAKSDNFVAPIAREFMLGNSSQATQIFQTFKSEISRVAVGNTLEIRKSSSFLVETGSCEPSLFSSSVRIPIKFGSYEMGDIEGSASYISWQIGFLVFGLLTSALLISQRILSIILWRRIAGSILDPIIKISKGEDINVIRTPVNVAEVLEINNNICKLSSEIKKAEIGRMLAKNQVELFNLSVQVAHDIRSPLMALNVALATAQQIPAAQRSLISSAMLRIEEIANDLISTNSKSVAQNGLDESPKQSEILSRHNLKINSIERLVSEGIIQKKLEIDSSRAIEIEFENLSPEFVCNSEVDGAHFSRLLSNILNNSIDSIVDRGRIFVTLQNCDSEILITIIDSGSGIPTELMPEILIRGASFGKPNGSGLGLYHADKCIREWGGKLSLHSSLGSGTTITIFLPSTTSDSDAIQNNNEPFHGLA